MLGTIAKSAFTAVGSVALGIGLYEGGKYVYENYTESGKAEAKKAAKKEKRRNRILKNMDNLLDAVAGGGAPKKVKAPKEEKGAKKKALQERIEMLEAALAASELTPSRGAVPSRRR